MGEPGKNARELPAEVGEAPFLMRRSPFGIAGSLLSRSNELLRNGRIYFSFQ